MRVYVICTLYMYQICLESSKRSICVCNVHIVHAPDLSSSGVGTYFPWWAALSQWTWLQGQYIDKHGCFQYVEYCLICNSWGHSQAEFNIVAGRIWPAGCNVPTPGLNRSKRNVCAIPLRTSHNFLNATKQRHKEKMSSRL